MSEAEKASLEQKKEDLANQRLCKEVPYFSPRLTYRLLSFLDSFVIEDLSFKERCSF